MTQAQRGHTSGPGFQEAVGRVRPRVYYHGHLSLGIPRGPGPGKVFQRITLAAPLSGLTVNGGSVPVGAESLLELPHLLESQTVD